MEWGQRGGVAVADILDQIQTRPVDVGEETEGKVAESGEEGEEMAEVGEDAEVKPPAIKGSPGSSDSSLSPPPSEPAIKEGPSDEPTKESTDQPPAKRHKDMTLEEYEAMLDEDFDADLYNI